MTLSEILSAARARLDDEEPGNNQAYKWSDKQLKHWANEANIQACRRTRYLVDNSKSASIVSGTASYNFPDGVIFLQRAKLDGEDMPLCFASYKEMDEYSAGWQTHTGTPTHIIVDLAIDKYTLYPTPDAVKTLRFVAIIEPEPLTYESELPSRFGYGLIDWMIYRACQLRDADKEDINASLAGLAAFTAEFGGVSSAKDEVYNFRNRPFDNFDGNF